MSTTNFVDKIKVNTGNGSYEADLQTSAANINYGNQNLAKILSLSGSKFQAYGELYKIFEDYDFQIARLNNQLGKLKNINTLKGKDGAKGEDGITPVFAFGLGDEKGISEFTLNPDADFLIKSRESSEFFLGIYTGSPKEEYSKDDFIWMLTGKRGAKGEKGDISNGFRVLGTLSSSIDKAVETIGAQPKPEEGLKNGDAYFIQPDGNDPNQNVIFIYEGIPSTDENGKEVIINGEWKNQGRISGESAYEMALRLDKNIEGLTESEWVASLKGKDGKDGVDGKTGSSFIGNNIVTNINIADKDDGTDNWTAISFIPVSYTYKNPNAEDKNAVDNIVITEAQKQEFFIPKAEYLNSLTNLKFFGGDNSSFTIKNKNTIEDESSPYNLYVLGNANNITYKNNSSEYAALNNTFIKGNDNIIKPTNNINSPNDNIIILGNNNEVIDIKNLYIFGSNHNISDSLNDKDQYRYIFGEYANITNDSVFVIGNGSSNDSLSNLLTINKNSFNFNNLLTIGENSFNFNNLLIIDNNKFNYQDWTLTANKMSCSNLLTVDNNSFNYKDLLCFNTNNQLLIGTSNIDNDDLTTLKNYFGDSINSTSDIVMAIKKGDKFIFAVDKEGNIRNKNDSNIINSFIDSLTLNDNKSIHFSNSWNSSSAEISSIKNSFSFNDSLEDDSLVSGWIKRNLFVDTFYLNPLNESELRQASFYYRFSKPKTEISGNWDLENGYAYLDLPFENFHLQGYYNKPSEHQYSIGNVNISGVQDITMTGNISGIKDIKTSEDREYTAGHFGYYDIAYMLNSGTGTSYFTSNTDNTWLWFFLLTEEEIKIFGNDYVLTDGSGSNLKEGQLKEACRTLKNNTLQKIAKQGRHIVLALERFPENIFILTGMTKIGKEEGIQFYWDSNQKVSYINENNLTVNGISKTNNSIFDRLNNLEIFYDGTSSSGETSKLYLSRERINNNASYVKTDQVIYGRKFCGWNKNIVDLSFDDGGNVGFQIVIKK